MRSILFFFALFFGINAGYSQLNGAYTIGGTTPNYSTITAAVNDLIAQGVSGPVIFNIRSGIYNEHVIIPQITGASQTNNIIFQSEVLDSSLVRWEFNNTVLADNYVCKLNGADYISLRHLTLARELSSSQGSRTVIFENGANNNRVEHCRLLGRISSGHDYSVIYSPNTIDTANYIGYNKIVGGYTSIGLTGLNATTLEGGTVIEYNQGSSSLYSMKISYQNRFKIMQNTFNGPMDLDYFNGKSKLINNTLIGGGLDINDHLTTSMDSLIIAGNMLNGTTSYALHLINCPKVYVFHNTMYSALSSSSIGGVFYSENCNLSYANNIVQNTSTGYAAYFSSNTNLTADYNIYYSASSTNLIWRTSSYSTLTNWQNITPFDDHSYQSITNFIGTNNLHIFADIEASNNALVLAGMVKDLDGDIRSGTPDIGADEFDNPDHEAGAVKLMNIPTQICSGTIPLVAAIRNYGDINMTSVTVNWSVNGIVQPVVNWNGSVSPGDSAFVTLSNFYFAPSSTYNFIVWTTSPNGQVDAVPSNDSYTNTPVYTMMQGSYTVGGVSPDYPTISSCISALIQRGVCGPVVFNIRPGVYNEYLNFDGNSMNGLSWINTVTFQSETLDSTSVEMSYSNSSSSPLWMIDTWRAKHLTFRYMTFTRLLLSSWGNKNNMLTFDMANHITIENCVFRSHTNLIGKGLEFDRSSNIEIRNCVFKSMYSCVRVGYDAISQDSNVSIQNNQFFNFREKALVAYSIEDSLEIKNNYFTNDSLILTDGLTTYAEALLATLCGGVVEIMSNRIEGRYGETAMHVSCMNGTPAYKVKVHNNFVSVACGYASGGGGQGTIALVTYTNNYVDFQYNTFHMYGVSWSLNDKYCRAAVEIRPIPASQNIRFKNNIIMADSVYAFFSFPTDWNTTVFSDFDHNNFYYSGASPAVMASVGIWPGNWNANSVSINPLFYSKRDLHVLNPQLAMGIAVPAPVVPDDIDGDLRNHPTVGADEGNFDPINIGSIQTKVESDCDSAKVFAKVFNYCLDTITSFKLGAVSNGMPSPLYDWSGVLYPGDTTAWIQIGGFAQTNGQIYQVKTLTSLPNTLADQFIPNDTSSLVIYTAAVNTDTINLGDDLTGCASDSVLLSNNSPGVFTGLMWSTSETSESIYVNSSGTYTLTGTNISGCISTDTVVVNLSTPVAISLTQVGDTLFTSVSGGAIAWYHNNSLLPGETDTTLELSSFGAFYSTMTDSIGCISYSDTLQIENFRDAGIQDFHFDHECATTAISVDVKNFGTQNITSLEFELMVDGVVVSTPVWTGILANGDTLESFVLATVPHTFGQVHTINVTTELPNNDIDLFSLNDQLITTYHLQQPNFTLGSDTVICIGNSIQLYPSDSLNFSGFNWSTGETNALIITAQEGLFVLEAIDNFGCVRTDSIEIIVGGDVQPVISFSNGTLYSSMSTGNQWRLNTNPISNATADSFVPTQNGNYTVVYTDEYGCEAISAVYVVSTAGMIESEQTFSIYPNPASDLLNIVSDKTGTLDYRITDVSGKLVQTGKISPNAKVISLNNLQSGTYYITLSGSNSTLRFIK
ncbi:MAG: hypothetical protein K0S23_1097 [Fluviicola sp.]|jgi:hypothetical protein|uniref:T9SS type A sorting domain-containing protein n=1 Tax=Fluviicola sp. TaxID=1917219 RepID=UPI00260E342E|nr:T9SS type A sorting domain-containing protein [Fluviicola sp.]MDF3026790.1 hypothetical protein [Fluviicola sp.]